MARCARVRTFALSPACSRRAALLAGCGSGDSTDQLAGERRKPPCAAEERVPGARRPLAHGNARSGTPSRPNSSSRRRPRSSTRARTASPSASSSKDRTPVNDAAGGDLLRAGPRGQPESGKSGRQGRRSAGPQIKALEEPATGPFPAKVETPADQARLPRRDDQPTTRTRRRPSTRPRSTSPRTASGGSPALIKEGDKLTRDAAAERRRRPLRPRAPGRRPGADDPHADRGGCRRRRRKDHDADPARHPEQGRLRGRSRQGTDHPLVCDPPVLPESGLRPGRRRGRAGQTALRRQGGFHPHGDLQRQRSRARGPTSRCGLSTCRPSPGCSRSTRTGRSAK